MLAVYLMAAAMAHGENCDEGQSPFVGTWKFTSNWMKEGAEGVQVMTVNADHTGTVKDVENGWTTKLRNVELKGDALSFSFYFEDTKDYEVDFQGTLIGKEIKGDFKIFGVKAAVEGVRLSAEEAAKIAAQPSTRDIYEARSFTDSKKNTLQYQLFVPENYDPNNKYPLVLFHHGGGDNVMKNPGGVCLREWILPKVQANNPCFIVAPQFPGKKSKSVLDGTFSMRGHIQTIHEALDSLEKEFSIDKNREYVTGLSFGGECTWISLVERPDRFAAGVPICGTDVYSDVTVAERTEHLAQLPLWIFHGDADDVVPVDVSRRIVKALRDAGGNPKYTEYPGVNHNSWDQAYQDPELVEWLFAQKRNQNETVDSRSHSATTRGSSGGGTIGGRVPMSWVFFSRGNKKSAISVFTERGSVTLESLDVYELNSIWNGGRGEIYRPQFHYSPETGEMGDPNGLVYYNGEYHLFYQRGAWGHAVSTDMIRWQQLPDALTPDEHGGGHSVYSGSCVVDYDNTAGFKTGDEDIIVAIYTINNDGMQSQALAYSNDRGRTFTAYAGNPVMATEYDKRDPTVFWYEPDSKWVMALHNKYGVDFYSSPNLKDWTYMSRVEGFYECPDIFELPVDGDPKNTKWVLLDASNTGYKLGQFDGTTFIPETPGMPIDFGRNHYATQTFSNIPRSDGQTIQMAWMKSAWFPGMPFDQQQTFPSELSLRTYADGVRLYRAPIREIERIRGKHYRWSNEILERDEDLLSGINHDLIEIIAVFDLTDATSPEFGFFLRDALIYYYVAGSQLFVEHNNITKTATLKPENNKISMHILLDRASLEVYAN